MEIHFFKNQLEFRDWFEKNHDKAREILVGFYKKETGKPSLTWPESVDQALCYGWIDGQKRSFDDKYFLQKFTPRRPKSVWSKINKEKVEILIASGEMKPSGLRAVEAAKQDGRWDEAYKSQKNMSVPVDFQSALRKNEAAKTFFESLTSAKRYSFLFRIETAKKAETRERRIRQFVEMLGRGETF